MSDGETIDAYLRKATESLAGAESEQAAGRYNNCANRAYYACFQATIAALLRVGIGPSERDRQWRHDAVRAHFAEQIVNRRKFYPSAFRDVLARNALLRTEADYRPKQVDEVQSLRALRRSRDFVEAIRDKGATS